jgi:hypothetical protein
LPARPYTVANGKRPSGSHRGQDEGFGIKDISNIKGLFLASYLLKCLSYTPFLYSMVGLCYFAYWCSRLPVAVSATGRNRPPLAHESSALSHGSSLALYISFVPSSLLLQISSLFTSDHSKVFHKPNKFLLFRCPSSLKDHQRILRNV